MDTLASLSDDVTRAVETAGRSVVAVKARRRLPSTGVHWRPGLVVTADHTVALDEGITVTTPDGRTAAATIAGRDRATDIAVLKVEGLDLPVAERATAPLKLGQIVLALGFGPRVSWGVVAALGEGRAEGDALQPPAHLDLALYPGFSGGPLVDTQGRVAGMVTSGLMRHGRLGIPAATVARIAEQLAERGHVARGYLGLGMQPARLPADLGAALQPPREIGLLVVNVQPDGPGARAGVLIGDVLIALGGTPVTDVDDVDAALRRAGVGAALVASIIRGGARTEITVAVGERPRRGR
jgi:S1-C subfamily serine protease